MPENFCVEELSHLCLKQKKTFVMEEKFNCLP